MIRRTRMAGRQRPESCGKVSRAGTRVEKLGQSHLALRVGFVLARKASRRPRGIVSRPAAPAASEAASESHTDEATSYRACDGGSVAFRHD
jgi:hypothetical protein